MKSMSSSGICGPFQCIGAWRSAPATRYAVLPQGPYRDSGTAPRSASVTSGTVVFMIDGSGGSGGGGAGGRRARRRPGQPPTPATGGWGRIPVQGDLSGQHGPQVGHPRGGDQDGDDGRGDDGGARAHGLAAWEGDPSGVDLAPALGEAEGEQGSTDGEGGQAGSGQPDAGALGRFRAQGLAAEAKRDAQCPGQAG